MKSIATSLLFVLGLAALVVAQSMRQNGVSLDSITGNIDAGQIANGPISSSLLPSTVAYSSVDNNWSAAQTSASSFTVNTGMVVRQGADIQNFSQPATFASSSTHNAGAIIRQAADIQNFSQPATFASSTTHNAGTIIRQAANIQDFSQPATFASSTTHNAGAVIRQAADIRNFSTAATFASSVTVNAAGGFTGSVGVGTLSPASTLDVTGSAQFGTGIDRSTFSTAGRLTLSNPAVINSEGGINLNIDSDANGADQTLIIAQGRNGFSGGTVLVTFNQSGSVAIGTMTFTAISPPSGKALCLSAGSIGHCTDAVSAIGGCTCVSP